MDAPLFEQVAATPNERYALFQIIFQRAPEGDGNRLQLNNQAEGRTFRALLAGLGLGAIRETLARYGRVSSELLDSRTYQLFTVSREALRLYRERIADLPRSPVQEAQAGDFLDSLNAVGDPAKYFRDEWHGPASPAAWFPSDEDWAPDVSFHTSTRVLALPLQDALDRFSDELEGVEMPPVVERAVLALSGSFLEAISAALREDPSLSPTSDAGRARAVMDVREEAAAQKPLAERVPGCCEKCAAFVTTLAQSPGGARLCLHCFTPDPTKGG